jgi:uncharacterized SAM-binding protein YcdF (DUF218 family)
MFFLLSKILWIVINPFNVILSLLILGWMLLFKKPAAGKRLIGMGLLIIFFAGSGFLPGIMMRSLENRIPAGTIPSRIDGVIVLAGMVNMESSRKGLIELTEQSDRIIEGIIMLQKYPEAKLIITGGSGSLKQGENLKEADYLKKLAISLGVNEERILIERNSRNTHEHALTLAKMLHTKEEGQWVLITSAFHMPRSFGCFKKEGLNVIPYPVDYKTKMDSFNNFSLVSFLPTMRNLSSFNIALHEWLGLATYRLMNYTNSLFPKAD